MRHGSRPTVASWLPSVQRTAWWSRPAARILAYAFLGAGHFAKAKELTLSAAGVLEPGLGSASPAHLSLYGALLLKGRWRPRYQGDRSPAEHCSTKPRPAPAGWARDANHYFTAFGPTNVGVHRVSAAVALGDGGAAIQHAKAVHPIHLPVVERRALHLVDVARGHGQAGGDDQALAGAADGRAARPRRSPLPADRPGACNASAAPGTSRTQAGASRPGRTGRRCRLNAAIIGRAPWRAVPDRLRRTPSP